MSQSGHFYTPNCSQPLTSGNRGEVALLVQEEAAVAAQEGWGPFPERAWWKLEGERCTVGRDPREKDRWWSAVLQSSTEPHNFSCRSQCQARTETDLFFSFPNFPFLLDTRNRARNSMEIKDRGTGCQRAARCAASFCALARPVFGATEAHSYP